jgi:hypothetical protein
MIYTFNHSHDIMYAIVTMFYILRSYMISLGTKVPDGDLRLLWLVLRLVLVLRQRQALRVPTWTLDLQRDWNWHTVTFITMAVTQTQAASWPKGPQTVAILVRSGWFEIENKNCDFWMVSWCEINYITKICSIKYLYYDCGHCYKTNAQQRVKGSLSKL